MLNMLTAQKQQALMILMELENRGVSLEEIYGILHLDRLGKECDWRNGNSIDHITRVQCPTAYLEPKNMWAHLL